jgi:hypothetical protein
MKFYDKTYVIYETHVLNFKRKGITITLIKFSYRGVFH